MKNFWKILLEISEKIEKSEFKKTQTLSEEETKSLKDYVESHRKIREYNIDFLRRKISVYMCTKEIFKGIYGYNVENGQSFTYGIETTSDNGGDLISIPWEYHELSKLKLIITKVFFEIKHIKDRYGIHDNESEAYLFDYLVSEIVMDFVDLEEALYLIKEKKYVKTNLSRDKKFIFSISASGKYEDYIMPDDCNGVVKTRYRERRQTILIPRGKKRSVKGDISIWSHELYHSCRNTFAMIGDDIYLWDIQILEEYFIASLPILKKLLHGKLGK